jgi:hypothetical protein
MVLEICGEEQRHRRIVNLAPGPDVSVMMAFVY